MKYSHLFEKGKIGNLEIKNRIVMPAIGTMLAGMNGEATDNTLAYYEARAKGGVGLIISEITSIDDEHGKGTPIQLSVTDNKHIPMLHRLANTVHKYETKIFVQLHHAGRETKSEIIGGRQIVAPSPIMCKVTNEMPRELTNEEVKGLVKKFVAGAMRAKAAGIDGVELHGAHGYLINQFLSPYTNKRTDEYGGSFENRLRFITEIVLGIKHMCGVDFPVCVRISADEFVEGGINIEASIEIAKHLESIGVDAINVSNGIYETMLTVIEPCSFKQGWKLHLPKAIKAAVKIPVIAVNVIREPSFAENTLAEGNVDFVALGRANLADAEWSNKAYEGRDNEIRKCISCRYCISELNAGHHIKCAVNAMTGRELEFKDLKKDGEGRKVVVIGGGPSGMEASRVLAMRGFEVVIFEMDNKLGGQLNLANKALNKEKIDYLIDYLSNEIQRLGVKIRLNTKVTVQMITEEKPYAVFVATGSVPIIPKIEGVTGSNVFVAEEILSGKVSFSNENVCVIGSGMTGCETAELIASRGNNVSLIEMKPEIAIGIEAGNRYDMIQHLMSANISMLTSHKLLRINEKDVVLTDLTKNQEIVKSADKIVLALGVKPNNGNIESILNSFDRVKIIGDVDSPGNISKAIQQAFERAFVL